MAKSSFLLCVLALTAFNQLGVTLSSPLPIPYKSTKVLWYPTESGGYVPALLEGGPPVIAADEDKIHFLLFTLQNQNAQREVFVGDKNGLINAGYNSGAPLYILTHGFSSSPTGGPTPKFKTELFRGNRNVNIISIDWSDLAAAPWYDRAAAATKLVGQKTAKLVNFLVAEGMVALKDIHFAGHSLGAHAGGYLGANLGAGKLGRLTGLDPALPLFGEKTDADRIDPTDAAFVDVIHTAAGTLLDGGLAFTEPRGHVDFYPNSGSHQPGCGIDAFGTCSHSRCYAYMGESINNPNAFLACKCNSWDEYNKGQCVCNQSTHLGFHVPTNLRGNFYLKTNGQSPYSQS
ncbi:unnamed protein product [Allacma fusca]|uniref:Lipase domain-containing protein n=1 Tax=Allacma fusca TaxID=39272 RepID=A0A8J2JP70_9HEXA|nr:unnamed protein product [Allacma fusca]